MVGSRDSRNGELDAPLLGDDDRDARVRDRDPGFHGNLGHEDVVVPVDEPYGIERSFSERSVGLWDGNYDTLGLEATSRSMFQRIHEQNKARADDCTRRGGSLSQSKKRRYAVRNPIEKKSFVARAAYSARTDTLNFLYYVMIGMYMWPKWSWDAMRANRGLTVLAAKQGFSAGSASILCVVKFPQPYTQLSFIALWAVITTDLLYEANIGLSISKGFNRVLGTLAAGFLGFGLNQFGPEFGPAYPFFVVFCVTMGGGVFRFLKGIPPLKDQWGYAFTVATMAFHIFIITAYLDPEKWTLPMLRFSMILLGFALASIVNIAIQPIYAGDALQKLVAKNFATAASVFQRCVEEYIKDTKLDHVPDILSGRSVDDKIHQSYHEIVMSDADIDKLLSAVLWEPSHGKFFKNYPWDLYDDITDYLRYTLYDVIALDLCLRANIQAPKYLRELFAEVGILLVLLIIAMTQYGSDLLDAEGLKLLTLLKKEVLVAQEMMTIATECATILRALGDSIQNMKKFTSAGIMKKAEEAAVALQYKIFKNTDLLLGSTNPDCPSSPMLPPSLSPFANREQWSDYSSWISDEYFRNRNSEGNVGPSRGASEPINIASSSPEQNELPSTASSPALFPCSGSPQGCLQRLRSGPTKKTPLLETLTEGVPAIHVSVPKPGVDPVEPQPQEQGEKTTTKAKRSIIWQHTFSSRKNSLGHNWDGTLERISALSLVKFASLLIEVVTKMRYVVDCVEDLGEQARFEECVPS